MMSAQLKAMRKKGNRKHLDFLLEDLRVVRAHVDCTSAKFFEILRIRVKDPRLTVHDN